MVNLPCEKSEFCHEHNSVQNTDFICISQGFLRADTVRSDGGFFDLKMSYFFDVHRQAAGFHLLIFYINVFNKPHPPSLQATAGHAKGFILRRTQYQRA